MIKFNGYTSRKAAIEAVNAAIVPMGHTLVSVLGKPEANVKLNKSEVRTFPLNLLPAKSSGIMNTCPWKTAQCEALCLNTAGNPAWAKAKEKARKARTYAFYYAREAFIAALCFDIYAKVKRAKSDIAFRLNTTSDLVWEKYTVDVNGETMPIMEFFHGVQFYDYTKSYARALAFTNGQMPDNYHLTFSLAEDNDYEANRILLNGGSVAACVDYTGDLPAFFQLKDNGHTWSTYDADKSDYRPDDPHGIGILLPKGEAKNAKYFDGFVRKVA